MERAMKIIGTKEEKGILRKYPFLFSMLVTGGAAMLLSGQVGLPAVWEQCKAVIEKYGKEENLTATENPGEAEGQTDGSQGLLEAIEQELTRREQELAQANPENDPGNGELSLSDDAGNLQDEKNDELNQDLINNTRNDDEIQENANKSDSKNDEKKVGITKFVYYTPLEIDSYYYSDAGKTALTTEYEYSTVDESYFDDAVFIGDSRTVGISDYAGLDQADFYCESSMTIFKVLDDAGVTYQKTGKKADLKEVLQTKQYGKIYLMLGINELGYGNTEMYFKQYQKTVEEIRQWQPDAIIYIMANLHISKEKNNMQTEFNNVNINDKNAAIAGLANGTDIFYLDSNSLFTDENGFLKSDLTFDGVHLYAQHYDLWKQFLMEHAVVRE